MSFFWIAVWVEGGLAIIAIIAGFFAGLHYWDHCWCNSETIWQIALGLLPFLVGYYLLQALPFSGFRRMDQLVRELFRQYMGQLNLCQLALIAALAGIGEELLFRGLFQLGMSGFFNVWLAILITSLIFGLAHALTPTYFFFAFLASLYLGFLFEHTGNLIVPIAVHALYDFAVFLYIRYTLETAKIVPCG